MLKRSKLKIFTLFLSLFMILGFINLPKSFAEEQTPSNTFGNLDIWIPRKGEDNKESSKPRQFRYIKISDKRLSDQELIEAYKKFDKLSFKDIKEKENLGEGELSEESEIVKKDGKDYDLVKLRGIPTGTYIIKETEESSNAHQYRAITIAWYADQEVSEIATIEDKLDEPKSLKLHKIAAEKDKDGKEISLEGVKFNLIDEKGEALKFTKDSSDKYQYDPEKGNIELVTDKAGLIEIINLPLGKYHFRETQTIDPYKLSEKDKDKEEFTYNYREAYLQTVINSKEENFIGLHKVDDSNKSLAGVIFNLYTKVGDKLSQKVGIKDGKIILSELKDGKVTNADANVSYDYKTDENGKIIIKNLPELPKDASYVFKEVKSLDGYLPRTDEDFLVKLNDTVTVKNSKDKLNILLRKIDSISKKPIDKVGFQLYRKAADGKKDELVLVNGENGSYKSEKDAKESQLYTNKEGKIYVNNLPEGEYYFKENIVQKGYNLAENNGKTSDRLNRETTEVIVENTPENPKNPPKENTGGYRFVKVDNSKDKNRLKNAIFDLYVLDKDGNQSPYEITKDGKKVRVTLKSGENGEFEVRDLPFGKYRLRETAAPEGYILDTKPIDFEVTSTSYQKAAIMIENKKSTRQIVPPVVKTTKPNVPNKTYYVPTDTPSIPRGPLVKTGDIRIVIFMAIGMIMIFAGTFLVRKSEKAQRIMA